MTQPADARQVAIGLGSNLGERAANIDRAIVALKDGLLTDLRTSTYLENDPIDCHPGAPCFLNAAVVGTTHLAARDLLAACMGIEASLGRPRQRAYHADRLIDIDILLYGDLIIDEPHLTVPHPELHCRLFVLQPLAELASEWSIPGRDSTIGESLDRLNRNH